MNAFAHIVRDVFRQARASGLTAILLSLTAIAVVACFVRDWAQTEIDPANGLPILESHLEIVVPRAVAKFQFVLAGIVADTGGVLLALVWTAGFLPSFLDPSAASVMLAKPTSRTKLFVARWSGVMIYVAVFATLFVGSTWVAIGISSRFVWTPNYWLCVPILVAHFAVFYAFSCLLAVVSRNATVCIVGSFVFWALCWAMNYGRHALAGVRLEEVQRASAGLGRIADLGYWIMPKPADFGLILADVLNADQFATPWMAFKAVREAGQFHPLASVFSSLAVGAVFLAIAAYEFVHDEY